MTRITPAALARWRRDPIVFVREALIAQSGQIAKSAAVSGRSPLLRLSAGSHAPVSRPSSSR
jgi:hypothetical protein